MKLSSLKQQIEELSQLSDEELRVKVAEKMGAIWVRLINAKPARSLVMPDDDTGAFKRADMTERVIQIHDIPPYSTSLDAIHEAEKTLKTDKQKDEFSDHLMHIMDDVFPLWHATARQRAIAFLLV